MKGLVPPDCSALAKMFKRHRPAPFPWGSTQLPVAWIYNCCRELGHGWRERMWCPMLSFWYCVLKQMHGGVSLRMLEHMAYMDGDATGSGARDGADLTRARQRLPNALFQCALWELGTGSTARAQKLFAGLRVAFLDGIVFRAPRTRPNLDAFDASINWTGFTRWPLVRAVMVSCGCTGQILDVELGGWQDAERALLRPVLDRLRPGFLIVADRGFCSLMALWYVQQRAGHMLCRMHQTRRKRKWRAIGPGDYLCCWPKKGLRFTRCAEWRALAPQVEQDLWVRVIERTVVKPGYRPLRLTLATTLLDLKKYSAAELIALYFQRWGIECDFRTLKCDYGVQRLTAKTPHTVYNEILSAAVAFSLVAIERAQAGNADARRLSARTARLLILHMASRARFASKQKQRELHKRLLQEIRLATVPMQVRPPEPRAIVHYGQRYPSLTISRHRWRQDYLKGTA